MDRRPDSLDDSFLTPPSERRGSFAGGPGIIFLFLVVLIVAAIGIYGAASGNLSNWADALRQLNPTALWQAESGAEVAPEAAAGMPAPRAADGDSFILTPMGPAELLAARTPPRSLHLPIGDFDRPPVERYARPALFLGQKPRLAVVIVNLGHNSAVTAAAIADTPPEVTLSFSPYAPDLAGWIAAAQAFGHEVMLDLPLETRAYPDADPGPLGLLTALNDKENASRLENLLSGATGVIGLATQGGDRFLNDAAALKPLLAELGTRGYGLFVASPGKDAVDEAMGSLESRPRRAAADVEIGHDLSRQAIQDRLAAALARSRNARRALIAVQPYPLSVAAFAQIGALVKNHELVLVPASALLARE